MIRRLLTAALLCALSTLLARPAQADTPRPLVVDMTTLTRTPRTTAIVPLISAKTPFQPGTYPMVSGAAPEFLDRFRWAYPASPDLTCPADLAPVEADLEKVRGLIVELELDKALSILQEAYQNIPCQTALISRDTLRRLFYFEGIVRHYQGQDEDSSRAFLEALAVDQSLTPLEGFPPEINEVYQNAARQLASITPVRLDIDPALKQAGVQIDGTPLPDSEQLSILPGRHMAQVANEEGMARGAIFTIEAGEVRPMSQLIQVMPPGSASYLNALLRAALQSRSLNGAQTAALDTVARQSNHPMLMFVVVAQDATGALTLLTFAPGKGLIEGAPPGLTPLPPMEGDSSAPVASAKGHKESRKPPKEEKKAPPPEARTRVEPEEKPRERQTSPKPGEKPRERQARAPKKPAEEETPGEKTGSSDMPDFAMRLELGVLGYDGATFTSVMPTFAYRVLEGLHVQAGLNFANDLGMNGADGALSLLGIRLGAEYVLPLGPLMARGGLGYSLAAARVVTNPDGTRSLLLEATPELWLGGEYPLSDSLRVGLETGVGFSPGLVNAASSRVLWRAGLTAGWVF